MTTHQTRQFLRELRTEVERHAAVNHLFLNRLATVPFSRQDYRVFGEHHYPLVCLFTAYLERLLTRAPSSESKLWLAKVLVDEYGEGSRGEDHAALYRKFLRATASARGERDDWNLPEPAQRFIDAHLALVKTQPFLVGLGAVGPGHEWAIPRMFTAVIAGLVRAGFDGDEIEYFTLHVEQDVDHGSWLEEALFRFGSTDAARQQIRAGTLASLEARGRFWSGVERAVVRYRQPRSVRLDGPRPRSILGEVALTAWDGSRVARAAEARFRMARDRMRPALGELLERVRR